MRKNEENGARKKQEKIQNSKYALLLCFALIASLLFLPILAEAGEDEEVVASRKEGPIETSEEWVILGYCNSEAETKITNSYQIVVDSTYVPEIGDELDYDKMNLRVKRDTNDGEFSVEDSYPLAEDSVNILTVTPEDGTLLTEALLKDGKLTIAVKWEIAESGYEVANTKPKRTRKVPASTYETDFEIPVSSAKIDTNVTSKDTTKEDPKTPDNTTSEDTSEEASTNSDSAVTSETQPQVIHPTASVNVCDVTERTVSFEISCDMYCTVNLRLFKEGTETPIPRNLLKMEGFLQEEQLQSVKDSRQIMFSELEPGTKYVMLVLPVSSDKGQYSKEVYRVDFQTKAVEEPSPSQPTTPPTQPTTPPTQPTTPSTQPTTPPTQPEATIYLTKDIVAELFGSTHLLGDIVIPTYYEKDGTRYRINGVVSETFSGNDEITSITFEGGLTYVGDRAFHDCASMTRIDLSACAFIGEEAFYNCNSLSNVNLSNCTSVGANAFAMCDPSCFTITYNGVTYGKEADTDTIDVIVQKYLTALAASNP